MKQRKKKKKKGTEFFVVWCAGEGKLFMDNEESFCISKWSLFIGF